MFVLLTLGGCLRPYPPVAAASGRRGAGNDFLWWLYYTVLMAKFKYISPDFPVLTRIIKSKMYPFLTRR